MSSGQELDTMQLQRSKIRITLRKATLLNSVKGVFSRSESYCVLTVDDGDQYKTTISRGMDEARWLEHFDVDVHPNSIIKVQVYDRRKASQRAGGLVSWATFNLSDVISLDQTPRPDFLIKQHACDLLKDAKYDCYALKWSGKITLYFSPAYSIPTEPVLKRNIRITLIEAKSLMAKRADVVYHPNCYVITSVGMQRKTSRVIRNQSFPVFNEQYDFVAEPGSVISFEAWDTKRADRPDAGLIGAASFSITDVLSLNTTLDFPITKSRSTLTREGSGITDNGAIHFYISPGFDYDPSRGIQDAPAAAGVTSSASDAHHDSNSSSSDDETSSSHDSTKPSESIISTSTTATTVYFTSSSKPALPPQPDSAIGSVTSGFSLVDPGVDPEFVTPAVTPRLQRGSRISRRRPGHLSQQTIDSSLDMSAEIRSGTPANVFERRQTFRSSISFPEPVLSPTVESMPTSPAEDIHQDYDPNPHLGPLPPNWEMRLAPSGQVYYVDYENRTTTWDDPRRPTEEPKMIAKPAAEVSAAPEPVEAKPHSRGMHTDVTAQTNGDTTVRPKPKPTATRMASLLQAVRAMSILKQGILPPTIVDITKDVETIGERVALGGSCDIYRGIMRGGMVVAIKRPRVMNLDDEILRRFNREADTWSCLRNARILPLLGTCEVEGYIHLVAPWEENGNLMSYVEKHPELPFGMRRRLLQDVAEGLSYLHRKGVVHGDLKLVNVLMGSSMRALLCDFGLSKMFDANTSEVMKGAGTYRWTAPEILEDSPKSPAGDMYAYAMCIVEMLTGTIPFPELCASGTVMVHVMRGDRPELKPETSPDGHSYNSMWGAAQKCWSEVPTDRLKAQEVVQLLQKIEKEA
ncbi:hypothetical protein FRB93_001022 [Tulasnella sp. JGI-2019a]|nr:hypothetical protein FRB93_001022 [Tulasnella sp. JGI-2019a]